MQLNTRKTMFAKVVFRSYTDSSFNTPEVRGEIDEHLGILGPVIKAEVGQSIMVRLDPSAEICCHLCHQVIYLYSTFLNNDTKCFTRGVSFTLKHKDSKRCHVQSIRYKL